MLFYPLDQHFRTRLSLIVDGGPAIAPALHRLLRGSYPELALVGLATSLAAARLLESLLFGVAARDPWTFVAVPMVLAAVAVLAALPPAVRASRLDPLLALKAE